MATLEPQLDPRYVVNDVGEVVTPCVLVYPEMIAEHIITAVEIAGSTSVIRPHCKTHKTVELARMEIEAGLVKHKCATIPEAEMLAEAGAQDVLLAYPLIGPNARRFCALQKNYPDVAFSALVDHPKPLAELSEVMASAGQTARLLLDLDVGLARTGVPPGDEAASLYRQIRESVGVEPAGLHVYDGHAKQSDPDERFAAVDQEWAQVKQFVARLESEGLEVPLIVCGGTASFPRWARLAKKDGRIEASPGTFFLNDWGYYSNFGDLPFQPAAVLLSRVISRPRAGRLTLDLGTKGVASDPPMQKRARFLNLSHAEIKIHNEEHMVVDAQNADAFLPGDLVYAWAGHICPSCALQSFLYVVKDNRVVDRWPVAARDRIRRF